MYKSKGGKNLEERLNKFIENVKESILIGGDFNVRTGELGESSEEGEVERYSKDKVLVVGNGGKEFVK